MSGNKHRAVAGVGILARAEAIVLRIRTGPIPRAVEATRIRREGGDDLRIRVGAAGGTILAEGDEKRQAATEDQNNESKKFHDTAFRLINERFVASLRRGCLG